MSPELIHGQQYDAKSDIWALGCLIYELCAWRPPFHQAQSQPELAKLIREGRIPNLPQGYSTALNQVVKSMLRQDLRQRPTAKQILGHEHVKFQLKGLKMRKIHDALVSEREALTKREQALQQRELALAQLLAKEAELAERERLVSLREKRVQVDKDALEDEKERLVQALAGSSLTCSGTTTDSRSETSDSLFDDQDFENRQPPSSASSINSEQGDAIKRVASRPSMVPRRGPLEERRSLYALKFFQTQYKLTLNQSGQLQRRLSSNSLMSLDETPGRNSPSRMSANYNPPTVTLSSSNSSIRKRITASKSMYNLNAGCRSSGGKQLFPSQSRDCLRSAAASQNSALPSPTRLEFPGGHRLMRAASASPLVEHPPTLAPSSPSKRSAAIAFFSPRDSVSSLSSLTEAPAPIRPSSSIRTATAPAALPTILAQPSWNLEDEDSLPSPFLRKKASSTNIIPRATAAAAAARGAPPVPPRTLRPSTSRLSLANKLAVGRATRAVMDEQGRIVDKKSVVSSTVS